MHDAVKDEHGGQSGDSRQHAGARVPAQHRRASVREGATRLGHVSRFAPIRAAWLRATDLAAQTPATRNRYIDFLRAASIMVVVLGHWLMAAPAVEREAFTLSDMLHVAPWSQWLTWLFQVMPLFFIVGGYANAASWSAHASAGNDYSTWVSRRLQRLVRPLVPLIVAWCLFAVSARWIGLSAAIISAGSTIALLPLWFLAVYVIVITLAPLTHRLWVRHGLASFWALVAAAVVVSAVSHMPGLASVRWSNYAFVWLAFHQLGHAWRHGAFAMPGRALLLAAAGFGALLLLRFVAGYPVSMVTVPGDPATNTNPPSIALLALGLTHGGLVIAAEALARRWLERQWRWAATVLINSVILTLYLWHTTVMVLLVALLEWPGGFGLALTPNSAAWWLTRPLWIAALVVLVGVAIAAFGRFEMGSSGRSVAAPAAWRSVAGAVTLCAGLVWIASVGIGAANPLGFHVGPVAVTLMGALLIVGRDVRRRSA
jgi:fucose 4-O-acetylase-like acetyltransferase